MSPEELANLTDDELLQLKKKLKSSRITYAFLIGLFIGVAVYSTVNNGFGFFTFFPLFFVYLLTKDSEKGKALNDELKTRNLQ
jgi:hypothetical protein